MTARRYYSIFNDVLGPVMTGPSSSHSAGCNRIGRTAAGLFGRPVTRADIVFDQSGSYPSTFVGQGSNYGFVSGLMGWQGNDCRTKDAIRLAREDGRDFRFSKEDLGAHHPNEAEIRIYNEKGQIELSLLTYSVGGGMFEIRKMNGFEVLIDGNSRQVFVEGSGEKALQEVLSILPDPGPAGLQRIQGQWMLKYRLFAEAAGPCFRTAAGISGVKSVRTAEPVMPVIGREHKAMPFYKAKEALEYAADTQRPLWQAALDYECAYGFVNEADVISIASGILQAMRASMTPPDPEDTAVYGILPYQGRKMLEHQRSREQVPAGALEAAMMAAVAVMENNSAHNIVVAAPTAGSSGVIPAALISIGEQMGKSEEEVLHALLTAGLIGVFIANQATFGAEVAACQAENGSASCMAAGGAAALIGCDARECFAAASMAMQNMLGLICDPVAGLAEVPCITRNVAALSNAVMSANLAALGFDAVIPLDEAIQSMMRVGTQLPAALRCTCEGGICDTDTARCLSAEMEKTRPVL